MIDISFVEKLLELLNSSNVGSIEVRKNLWSTSIRVSKATTFENSGPVTYQVSAGGATTTDPPPPPPAAPSPPLAGGAGAGAGGAVEEAEAAEPALIDVKSPMVGTFYARPEPGAEPYVQEGSHVTPGQALCIIEAMKIMNPIDAEVSGVIKQVCVQDAQPVEFGHVLFKVDPNG